MFLVQLITANRAEPEVELPHELVTTHRYRYPLNVLDDAFTFNWVVATPEYIELLTKELQELPLSVLTCH